MSQSSYTAPEKICAALPHDPRRARTWAEVDLSAVRGNIAAIRERLDVRSELLAVVKADAYGHGATVIARECEQQGVGHFGVASVEEAKALRRAGIRSDIYLLSPFLPEEAPEIVRSDLTPFLSSLTQLEALIAAAAGGSGRRSDSVVLMPARCFLAVDSGMGREGCTPDEAYRIWMRAAGSPVRVTGIATHFSRADEPGIGDTVSREQSDVFMTFVARLVANYGFTDGGDSRGVYLTLANSPATLRVPSPDPLLVRGARGCLMRGGLLTYGIEPYADAFACHDLRPVLSWRARVSLVRDFAAGTTIGYGQTYVVPRPSRIATLSAGYADGLSRQLSNRGTVLVRGHRCPVVGRVSMDQCQIDVTEIADIISLGDTATLIGRDGNDQITVLEMAERIGTTPHEPTCALSARVPRIYL